MNATPSRASHVNTGTAIAREDLPQPTTNGRVMRLPTSHVEVEEATAATRYGGLILVVAFLKKFGGAARLDAALSLLKQHQPYTEADHVLALAMTLYVGGTCLEDQAQLQGSEAVRRIVGACRLPDPTTAGDFLRRFDPAQNPGSLEALRQVVDAIQEAVWQELERKRRGTKRKPRRAKRKPRGGKREPRQWMTIDIDAHSKEVYGHTKEGADFSRRGTWSYKPLVVSMAHTGEVLAVRNRPGNVRDSEGAAEVLDEVLARVCRPGVAVLVRGDSDFDRRDMREVCESHGAYFAFVGREFRNRPAIAEAVPEDQWQRFQPRAARHAEQRRNQPDYHPRRKRGNRRQQRARARGYKEMRLVEQWITEVPGPPAASDKRYRLVLRRQRIEHRQGEQILGYEGRYRYIVTNLPSWVSTEQVLDLTYERCDQENLIEQMGSGLAAWRMPTASFWANHAWLEIARLAWNVGKWIAQLALSAEVVRWEWKRFRRVFVNLAAHVVKRSRQIWVRFSARHRFLDELVSAHHCMLC